MFDESFRIISKIVVDWLESIAEKLLEDNYNRIEFSMDRMGAWYVWLVLRWQLAPTQKPFHFLYFS